VGGVRGGGNYALLTWLNGCEYRDRECSFTDAHHHALKTVRESGETTGGHDETANRAHVK
jgi:hypothetical protein